MFTKNLSGVIQILIIQLGHNFAYGPTAELSGHVQNCDLIGSLLLSKSTVCL